MKKRWIILSVIAITVAGVFLYLKFKTNADFEPLIKAKLQQIVKVGSNGLYELDMDKIETDVLRSKVKVRNASLLINSVRLKVLYKEGTAPVDVYKISLSSLKVNGFNVDDLF